MQKIVITSGCAFALNETLYKRLCELGCQRAIEDKWVFDEDLKDVTEHFKGDDSYILKYKEQEFRFHVNVERTDPLLIQLVEETNWKKIPKAFRLKVVEIPDDVKWYIFTNEMGFESIHEEHRVWR